MTDAPSEPLETVELRLAFEWTCPDCGVDFFARSMMVDLGPSELQELRDEHGVEAWETGEFQMMPRAVYCTRCGKYFKTKDAG